MRIKKLKTSEKQNLFHAQFFDKSYGSHLHYIGEERAFSCKPLPIKSFRLSQSGGSTQRITYGDYVFDTTNKKIR